MTKGKIRKFFFAKGSPAARVLSIDELDFWEKSFDRNMKIGIEIEFNLKHKKTAKTICQGNSAYCPCTKAHDRTITVNKEEVTVACYELCANKRTCAKKVCLGNFCPDFTSPCFECSLLEHNCHDCDFYVNNHSTPNGIRRALQTKFQPNSNYFTYGKTGIGAVTSDGSLENGGVEVITNGRKVDYYAFYEQLYDIYKETFQYDVYMDERTSVHYHVLMGYGSQYSDIERSVPEIVMRNLHQLFRIFEPALIWISSAGDSWEHLTRWAKFRKSVGEITGTKNNAWGIKEKAVQLSQNRPKYSLINYERMCFDSTTQMDVKQFHYEARFSDGIASPTAVAALAVLLYSITRKALAISVHRIIAVPTEFYDVQKKMTKIIMNGGEDASWDTANRFSDTAKVRENQDYYINLSLQLVDFIAPYLRTWPESIDVLRSLAMRPCSVRRIDKMNWKEIEQALFAIGRKNQRVTEEDLKILQLIDLNTDLECKDEEEWLENTSSILGSSRDHMENRVQNLLTHGKILWDKHLKSYVRS